MNKKKKTIYVFITIEKNVFLYKSNECFFFYLITKKEFLFSIKIKEEENLIYIALHRNRFSQHKYTIILIVNPSYGNIIRIILIMK